MGSSRVDFFYCKGDINSDKKVDISDLVVVASAYGSQLGDPNWNINASLNNDNVVDIFDLDIIALNYGKNVEYCAREDAVEGSGIASTASLVWIVIIWSYLQRTDLRGRAKCGKQIA
jgi:hypothetical protein